MRSRRLFVLCTSLAIAARLHGSESLAAPAADAPEVVIISAALRPTRLADFAGSATALGAATLRAAGEQHLADVLGLVPDLAAAGGTSRPRYFYLRGVGEREQYQGAPNPSVAFLVDDIDLSGVGMPATLFDVAQVEVLRGPQGTAYGANALAGLINVVTEPAREQREAYAELQRGDYGSWSAGLTAGGPVGTSASAWRLVAQHYRSNGFRRNVFLGRDDTNGFDERTLRGKLLWPDLRAWRAELSTMAVDIDNGYDAWSLDNTRDTRADHPGRDAQRTRGAALRLSRALGSDGMLRSVSSAADSRSTYSYDGDWANNPWWGVSGPYDFQEAIRRRRRTAAEDVRYLAGGGRWLLGAYALRLRESQSQVDHGLYGSGADAFGPYQTTFDSEYSATQLAVYGQREWRLRPESQLTMGLRLERRDARYRDSLSPERLQSADRMWGGSLAYRRALGAMASWYAALSRGYKAGGYNIGSAVPAAERQFGTEALWNLETGYRIRRDAPRPASLGVAVFAMRRPHQQVQRSSQTDTANPLLFVYLTENAGGDSRGVEIEGSWQPAARWLLGGSLALLDARYRGYCYQGSGAPGACDGQDLDGRRQAFAPPYQLALSVDYVHPSGIFARLDWQASAARYFGPDRHEYGAGYRLANLHAGWRRGPLQWELWVRNLGNSRYALHGFYFGNEPPDFAPRLYLQSGDPRHFGASVRYALAPAR